MNNQFSRKNWCMAATVLVLILALAACSPFGRTKGDDVPPTEPPPPTETPLPVLPTYTPTKVTEIPTATSTATVAEGEPEKPTLTPTPESQKQVGGEEPVVVKPVSHKVTSVPTMGDVIRNGSFEEGFRENGVAEGWTAFDNERAVYEWVDDLQSIHVTHGSHAQLMRIMGPGEADRYVGIYQTVDVVAGETYTLSLHGLIRSSTAARDDVPYGHRMQWAIDYQGGTNWYQMTQEWGEWTDPGWNDIPLDDKEPVMSVYTQQITPETDKLTLYIRGWTKWAIMSSEAKYYVDGVSLKGPVPGEETVVEVAVSGGGSGEGGMPSTGGTAIWIPVVGVIFVLGFAFWEMRKVWLR